MAGDKRAVSTFQTTIKGEEYLVHAGDVLPDTDPVVKARGELFEPVTGAPAAKRRSTRKT